MKARVRTARPEELAALGELIVAAYRQYFPTGAIDAAAREAWDRYERDLRDVGSRMPESEQLVAERDGTLVGGVSYFPPGRFHFESDDPHLGTPAGWAGIRVLAVHPDARGLGIGRLLMDDCLRRAHEAGAEAVALHTTELMVVARSMYERLGFTREPRYDFRPIPGSDFTVLAYLLPLQPQGAPQ